MSFQCDASNTANMDPEAISYSPMGFFAVLPIPIENCILSLIQDVETYAKGMRVCKRWKKRMEEAWYYYCLQQNWLQNEAFLKKHGRSWKWICQCKYKVLKPKENREGIGSINIEPYEVYEGEWKNSKRNGVGVHRWRGGKWNGDMYAGQWLDDNMHGKGRYTFATGSYYEVSVELFFFLLADAQDFRVIGKRMP